jgi:hypothetical protein
MLFMPYAVAARALEVGALKLYMPVAAVTASGGFSLRSWRR